MRRLYIISIRKTLLLILPISFFVALFLFLESNYSSMVFSSKEEPRALQTGNEANNAIALTFNISHGDEQALPILERLEKEDVTATFFLSGEWAERHPDIVEKITEGQHEIGMLGYEYASYTEMEAAAVQKDILKSKDVFQKLGLEDTYLLRAPNGHLNEEIISLAEQQGLKVVHWSLNPDDWTNPGVDKIAEDILENVTNGDIILLHASDSVKQTEQALELVLPKIKASQSLVTVSELISQAETEQEILE